MKLLKSTIHVCLVGEMEAFLRFPLQKHAFFSEAFAPFGYDARRWGAFHCFLVILLHWCSLALVFRLLFCLYIHSP